MARNSEATVGTMIRCVSDFTPEKVRVGVNEQARKLILVFRLPGIMVTEEYITSSARNSTTRLALASGQTAPEAFALLSQTQPSGYE